MGGVSEDVPIPIGIMSFASIQPARGHMFWSAQRTYRGSGGDPVVSEKDLYE